MKLTDEEARRTIAAQLDTNILVEAGAGSGKTASLVKRMVNLVLHGRCKVEEMAAITFTRKAAAELRERFQDQLEKSLRGAVQPQARQVLSDALMNLDRCFVGTIHAFCGKLLRERPVEAGIDPGFEELDEVQNAALLERAWQEYLLEIKAHRPRLLEAVERIGVSPDELKDLFHRFSGYPEVEVPYRVTAPPDFTAALQELQALVREALQYIPDPPREDRYDSLQVRILRANRLLNTRDLQQHANAAAVLSRFEKIPAITLIRWLDKNEAKNTKARLEQFGVSRAAPLLQAWREHCYGHVAGFLLPGREFLRAYRDKHGLLGFHDLLMKTARMLREHPDVRLYFQGKYRCLLVDEFQDTDPLQSEVMFCLTGSDLQEKNWQQLSPRPGSLFVVGDPKQSIYRFRRADIDTYNRVKELMESSGGRVLQLTTNFRCLEPLERFCNQVFRQLLAPGENRYQARYSPIEAWRRDVGRTDAGVRTLEVGGDFRKKEDVVLQDAAQVASFVRWGLEGGIRLARSPEERQAGRSETPCPGDFLILLGYKEMMETYARALEEQGIAVTMTGGSSLAESVELSELLKLLRCLDDPQNPVLLVAVLKGLFFGVSDSELYRFKTAGGRFYPLSRVPPGMDGGTLEIFKAAYGRLALYLKWKRTYPPAVTLEKIIEDLGLVPFVLSQPLGERNCSYVYQVLEYIRRGGAGSGDPFREMIEQFAQLVDAGVEEELELHVSGGDSVRLMNLHKAKGLEAPVVILANPAKRVEPSSDRIDSHVVRTGDRPVGYFSFTRSWGFQSVKIAQPGGWDEYAAEEQRYLEAERIRLLYVAATRARNLLVISTSAHDAALKKNPWGELLTYGDSEQVEPIVLPGAAGPVEKAGAPPGEEELDAFLEELRAWSHEASTRGWCRVTPSGLAEGPWEEGEGGTGEGAFTTGVGVGKEEGVEMGKEEQKALAADASAGARPAAGGADWGLVMHRGLEALVQDEADLEGILEAALEAVGLPQTLVQTALEQLEQFINTPLWQAIQAAGENRLTEVPFSLSAARNELPGVFADPAEPDLVLVSGVIDLAYRGPGGWVIVDYKTDRVQDESHLQQLIASYTPQVELYRHCWEQIAGEKTAEAGLFFTHPMRYMKVGGG